MSNEYPNAVIQDRKRSAHWTDDDTALLVQILLKHKDISRTQDNGFKPEVWREASTALQPITMMGGVKTAEACKSRWQRLQRDFKAAKDVACVRGISWSHSEHRLQGTPEAWAEAEKRFEPYKWKKIYLPWYNSFEQLCPSSGERPLLTRRQRGSIASISTMDTSMLSVSGSSMHDSQLRTPSQSSSTHTAMFSASSNLSTPADELAPEVQQAVWDMAQVNGSGFNPVLYQNHSMLQYTMPYDCSNMAGPSHIGPPPNFTGQHSNSGSPLKRQKTWHESLRSSQRQTRSKQALNHFQHPFATTPPPPMPPQFNFSPDTSSQNHAMAMQAHHLMGSHGMGLTYVPMLNSGPLPQASVNGQQFSPGTDMKSDIPMVDRQQASHASDEISAAIIPFEIIRAGFTDAQRRTEALLLLQDKETYLGEAGLLEVVSEFESNIASCDTYLAMKVEELRRQWIQRLLARRKRAGRS